MSGTLIESVPDPGPPPLDAGPRLAAVEPPRERFVAADRAPLIAGLAADGAFALPLTGGGIDWSAAVRRLDDVARRSPDVATALAGNLAAAAAIVRFGEAPQRAAVRRGDALALARADGTGAPAEVVDGTLTASGLRVDHLLDPKAYLLVAQREDGTRGAVLLAANARGVQYDGATLAVAGTPVGTAELLPTWSEEWLLGVSALLHGAIALGLAGGLLDDGGAFAREDATPWPGRTYASLIHDPHVIRGFGQRRARLDAARTVLQEAVAALTAERDDAVLAALAAQAEAADATAEIAATLPELLGPAGTDHAPLWVATEAARRHTLRDPIAWRHYAVGQHLLGASWSDPDRTGELPEVAPADGSVRPITGDDEAIAVARAYAAHASLEAGDRDRDRRHAFAELDLLSRTGLLGITVPAAYGGPEAGWATVAEVVRIVGAADGSISQILQPHFAAIEAIHTAGTEAQRRFFFRQALDGARFGSANGERNTKAAGDITTRLVPTLTGTYRVEGTKFYCTGSLSADWVVVTARDPAGSRSSALVHRDAEHLDLADDWSGIGQRTTASGTTRLGGVEVQELHVLAMWRMAEGAHLSGAKANLVHAAVNIGIGFGALAAGRDYILTRSRPSKDLGLESVMEDPHLVQRFGLLHGRLRSAHGLLVRAAEAIDAAAADPSPDAISAATIAVAEAEAYGGDVALQIGSEVFALAGAGASRSEVGLDRFWRDVRTHTLHDHAVWKYHQIGDSLLSGAQYFGNRRNVI
ncbi:MAG: SfnB family sulfur acquisition oxidoreductase [Solirubrobacterales bacterium]|nr:SfnB family sulfur acquisition oxidoreductase [Solirubrobacterales bacterium]